MKETFSHEFTGWQKLAQKYLGMWRINRDSIDFNWGYFAPRFGIQFVFNHGGYFDKQCSITFCFIWGVFDVKIPIYTKEECGCEYPTYGFQCYDNHFIIHLGNKRKYFDIPFLSYEFDYHVALGKDGTWLKYDYKKKEDYHTETHPYVYTLESGEVQNRTATCTVDIFQWHRKWFPFSKLIRKSIFIQFSNEVGERSGSWKGGCTGCSYDMLEGETIEQSLRRMERERKF